ncbi:LCCL domain-containing protein [Coprinopsis marcescibilis]|uniref:LCCL domain-containing protein n=1 Tax=Coprinopsis marcescibilis TaxID=230819 RepID=A0A5C3LPY7_COPMA|nr:LCCL domain-containing protein [Coprinopsis marcescibilis]
MAVPAELTTLNLSGKFTLNRSLTDPRTDTILSLQGVGWLKRKAISIGTITLHVKHSKGDDGLERINIDQTITGGIPGTSESRILSWEETAAEDHVFGAMIQQSRRVKEAELDIDFLKNGWTADTIEHGLIQSYTQSDTPKSGTTWIANQAWGIQDINGERRYVRRVKFTGPKGEDIEAPLVYDYRFDVDSSANSWRDRSAMSKPESQQSSLLDTSQTASNETVVGDPEAGLQSHRRRGPARTWIFQRFDSFSVSHPQVYSRISRVALWLRGPRPKVDLSHQTAITPLLDIDWTIRGKRIYLPIESTILKRTRPLRKLWLFAILTIGYIVGMAFLARAQAYMIPPEASWGCVGTFWAANSQCGLDGQDCLPMNTSETFDFRCPPGCQSGILQNPRTVGAEEVSFVPLLIGGGDPNITYRADSFICSAAIQAGVMTNEKGGCARLHLVPDFVDFTPRAANGLQSIGFPSIFPLAYRFTKESSFKQCSDLRNEGLALNALVTAAIFLLFSPRPIIAFWSLVCIGFWHIGLVSDPVGQAPSIERLFSLFLPALYIAYAFWRFAFRYTLPALLSAAPFETTILYLLSFWVGILNPSTLGKLPLTRLTAADIGARPGSLATFIILLLVVIACAINQLRIMRKTGWLFFYARWYALGGLVLLGLGLLPGLSLRLHHYIYPMFLFPGTAFPTRPSAIFQGLLLGLFLHGVARWGFAGIVQTVSSLRADAVSGSGIPTFLTNSLTYNTTIPLANQTVSWAPIPANDFWTGFSFLIDDVERYAGDALNFSLAALDPDLPHFFRIAYKSDSGVGDYTKGATLWPNGTWIDPLPGSSY